MVDRTWRRSLLTYEGWGDFRPSSRPPSGQRISSPAAVFSGYFAAMVSNSRPDAVGLLPQRGRATKPFRLSDDAVLKQRGAYPPSTKNGDGSCNSFSICSGSIRATTIWRLWLKRSGSHDTRDRLPDLHQRSSFLRPCFQRLPRELGPRAQATFAFSRVMFGRSGRPAASMSGKMPPLSP